MTELIQPKTELHRRTMIEVSYDKGARSQKVGQNLENEKLISAPASGDKPRNRRLAERKSFYQWRRKVARARTTSITSPVKTVIMPPHILKYMTVVE